MPHIRVRGIDQPLEVEADKDLMTALRARNINLFWGPWRRVFNCRGIGLCALCPVRVLEGADQLKPRTKREEKRMRRRPADWRLACQTHLGRADADVEIQPFPLIRPEERASPEAVARAHLGPEAREEAEAADKAELRARHDKDKAERKDKPKRRLLPFGKKKGDDAETAGTDAPKKRKIGLPVRKGKKSDAADGGEPPAAEPSDAEATQKAPRRFALKKGNRRDE